MKKRKPTRKKTGPRKIKARRTHEAQSNKRLRALSRKTIKELCERDRWPERPLVLLTAPSLGHSLFEKLYSEQGRIDWTNRPFLCLNRRDER